MHSGFMGFMHEWVSGKSLPPLSPQSGERKPREVGLSCRSALISERMIMIMNSPNSPPRISVGGFTLLELVVVVLTLCGMFLLIALSGAVPAQRAKSARLRCVDNLKDLGTAYRLWGNDNGDRYPAAVPVIQGGWADDVARPDAAALAWTNYVILANGGTNLSQLLVCPTDERQPTAGTPALTNLSYFIGADAGDPHPQSWLGGDRNLGPGTVPRDDYGYSPADGKGSNVFIRGPVCWSLKMHHASGNILLGDGSVQQMSSAISNPDPDWLTNSPAGTSPIKAPIHLLFP